jgi:hypothetical protein
LPNVRATWECSGSFKSESSPEVLWRSRLARLGCCPLLDTFATHTYYMAGTLVVSTKICVRRYFEPGCCYHQQNKAKLVFLPNPLLPSVTRWRPPGCNGSRTRRVTVQYRRRQIGRLGAGAMLVVHPAPGQHPLGGQRLEIDSNAPKAHSAGLLP